MSMFTASTSNSNSSLSGYKFTEPPDDTISRLRFSPPATGASHFVVAASWNGSLRVWQATENAANAVSMTQSNAPILDACWSTEGQGVNYASADCTVGRWDLGSNQIIPIGRHDDSVKSVTNAEAVSLIATGAWDKSVRYWDGRSPNSVGHVGVPERVYSMDTRGPLLVVALAARQVLVYDVRKPQEPFRQRYSALKYQTRAVATFPDSMGYAVAGVDGKASIEHVRQASAKQDYVFRGHSGHAINAVRFHVHSGTLATAGADGYLKFWDKERRGQTGPMDLPRANAPITDVDFSHDGSMVAYSTGYDWSQGSTGYTPNYETGVQLLNLRDGDLSSGGRGRGRGRRGRGGRGRGRSRGRGRG